MHFMIVTGMSGAGKTTVLKFLEDVGYYCADNLPPSLMAGFADICLRGDSGIGPVAIGIDIRGGKLFDDLSAGLIELESMGIACDILFLDASSEVLLRRYKETRHVHPLSRDGVIGGAISKERLLLADIRDKATLVIDTSFILPQQLKEMLAGIFVDKKTFRNLIIHIQSFGFKFGIPAEADLLFDVRFLPNPFYIPGLRDLTGLDDEVRDFVMSHSVSRQFLGSLVDMLAFLIPKYIEEGKNQLFIGIGCTGGRHRSVSLARELHGALVAMGGHPAILAHRDLGKGR